MINKCPGQDDRNIQSETISCPDCGYKIEIFSDEIKVKCPKCKKFACRDRLPSCVDWCKFAKECIGDQEFNDYKKNQSFIIKQKLIKELEEYFDQDLKRINHAKNVLRFAEEILKQEKGDRHIIIPASILHDVGIKAAEEKYGSNAQRYQEKEGPEIARKILLKIGLKKEDIDQICEIISFHHTPGKIKTQNFFVLYDADQLVNFKEDADIEDKEGLKMVIEKLFFTETGKELARKTYL